MFLEKKTGQGMVYNNLVARWCNYKRIAAYYGFNTYLFALVGACLSICIRIEIESSSNRIIAASNQSYYGLIITIHGFIMIFFVIMPGVYAGLGNILVPIQLGACEVLYPRINNLSIVLLPVSYLMILIACTNEYSIGIGWTMYPPYSSSLMTLSTHGNILVIYGLIMVGTSSVTSALNFVLTLYYMKCIGIILGTTLSIYVWSNYTTSIMISLVMPMLAGCLIMLLMDITYNTIFFDDLFGGDPIYYQHLFWFFGHPEVYILIIPVFGLINLGLCNCINISIFGNISMIQAMNTIMFLGTVVWSHHMYTVGLESDTRAYFSANTLCISIPTANKMFNWKGTILSSNCFNGSSGGAQSGVSNNGWTNLIMIHYFLHMFTFGGVTGILLGCSSMVLALHDTYYVVAHFHVVLSLSTVMGLILGLSMYIDMVLVHGVVGSIFVQCNNSSMLCYCSVLLLIYGTCLCFVMMHYIGFAMLPRRIFDYPDSINCWNCLCSIGACICFVCFVSLKR